MQLQVFNSPFTQEQADLLNNLLPTLTETQKIWLTGYLASSQVASSAVSQSAVALETKEPPITQEPVQPSGQMISKDVTILYGSQTGNAQGIAEKAKKTFESQGFKVTVSDMGDFKPNNLKKIQNLLIVTSTHGEGEPPDTAITFYEFLHGKRAPKLDDLRFSVLSLGDSSYEFFCQTGKDFDKRLEELGGTRIYQRVDCDLDYDEPAAKWLDEVLTQFLGAGEAGVEAATTQSVSTPNQAVTGQEYSRKNPFYAEVFENINLNGRGSNKETRHLEISLEESGLTYKPGDALGILPKNDSELVELLLKELKWNPEESVVIEEGQNLSFKESLTSYFEITVLTKGLVQKVGELSSNGDLQKLINDDEQLKEYMDGRDLIDLVRDFGPWGSSAQEFVSVLRKIPTRLYSIASSLEANPEEVHLTIGVLQYEAHGRARKGVCSNLTAGLEPGDKIPVYIHENKNFRLPENPEAPIIMVGPGTGVAPFRSFMQEREEIGATGKSWMFFGDQHFVTDFLYQTEWQKWLKNGVLTNMDVAFSRDSDEKVYVQHRMLQHSKELYQWLQEGAYFYVCGDKDRMAKDVQNTLIEIIEKEGNLNREQAEEYLSELRQQKRYLRDVY